MEKIGVEAAHEVFWTDTNFAELGLAIDVPTAVLSLIAVRDLQEADVGFKLVGRNDAMGYWSFLTVEVDINVYSEGVQPNCPHLHLLGVVSASEFDLHPAEFVPLL